jgi:hypothetical protein
LPGVVVEVDDDVGPEEEEPDAGAEDVDEEELDELEPVSPLAAFLYESDR